jgi:hypothetical protein
VIGLPRERLGEAGSPEDQARVRRRRRTQRTQGESRMRASERQAILGLGGAGVVVRAPFVRACGIHDGDPDIGSSHARSCSSYLKFVSSYSGPLLYAETGLSQER